VLKARTTRPASAHPRAQPQRTHAYVRFYNQERPHEAIGQRTPMQLYRRGAPWQRRDEVDWKYPRGWAVRRVRSNGQIKWQGRTRSIGEALGGWTVGLQARRGGGHRVYFRNIFLGELHPQDAGGLWPAAYVHPRPAGGNGRKQKL
jgi:hypothetical protein